MIQLLHVNAFAQVPFTGNPAMMVPGTGIAAGPDPEVRGVVAPLG
ncbi:hypothetical protein [Aeromonas bivalvium]